MIESILVTLFPVLFLTVLFRIGVTFQQKNIDMDGEPPIDRTLFYLGKTRDILDSSLDLSSASREDRYKL